MTRNCTKTAVEGTRGAPDWDAIGKTEHFVQFYRTEEYLIENLASYVSKGLWAEEKAIVILTPSHRLALEERLRLKNVDVASSVVRGRYLALDAREVLSKFMVGNRPDPTAFRNVVGELVRKATEDGIPLRAFGEMVALLWADDNREAAIELEQLWNALACDYAFALFCAYPAECATPKAGRPGLEHICKVHHSVIPFPA